MQDRKEEKVSRATRWEKNARNACEAVATIKVDAHVFSKYGYGGDPLKWAVGKVGFFAGKLVDGAEFVVNTAKEECCKTRPTKKLL
jgi:hypothetical protein